MNIKLISFDLDGTILKGEYISKNTIEAFEKLREKGIILIPNTGRSIDSLRGIFKTLNLDSYCILNTGSTIMDIKNEKIEKFFNLNMDDFRYIKSNFYPKYDISIYTLNSIYYLNNIFPEIIEDNHILKMNMLKFDENISECEIVRVNIMGNKKKLDNFEKTYNKKLLEKYYVVRNIDISVEILNKNASKGNALNYLLKKLGINNDEVLTIGDGNNDITMFENIKYSVAMGNASDYVKSRAKYVTDTIDEDGFVKILNELNIL